MFSARVPDLQSGAIATRRRLHEMEPSGGAAPPSDPYQGSVLLLNEPGSNWRSRRESNPRDALDRGASLATRSRDRKKNGPRRPGPSLTVPAYERGSPYLDLSPIRLSTPSGVLRHSACELACATRYAVHLQPIFGSGRRSRAGHLLLMRQPCPLVHLPAPYCYHWTGSRVPPPRPPRWQRGALLLS